MEQLSAFDLLLVSIYGAGMADGRGVDVPPDFPPDLLVLLDHVRQVWQRMVAVSNPEQPPATSDQVRHERPGEYRVPPGERVTQCRSCRASITWTRTAGDKPIPLSVATIERRAEGTFALSHFADCPQSKEWRQ